MAKKSLSMVGIGWKKNVPNKIKQLVHNQFLNSEIKYMIGNYEQQIRNFDKKTKKDRLKDRFYYPYEKHNISIGMLSLAPHNSSGYNLCKKAGACADICIGYSGSSQSLGRIKKSIMLKQNPQKFFELLVEDIVHHVLTCQKEGKDPVIRLNGYSDIEWETKKFKFKYTTEIKNAIKKYKKSDYKSPELKKLLPENIQKVDSNTFKDKDDIAIFDLFPDLLFYDYTKYTDRKHLENYYLTFSYDKVKEEFPTDDEMNITVIVSDELKNKLLKLRTKKYKYINGDLQDCRLLDYSDKKRKIILLAYQEPQTSDKNSFKEEDYAITSPTEFNQLILNPLRLPLVNV